MQGGFQRAPACFTQSNTREPRLSSRGAAAMGRLWLRWRPIVGRLGPALAAVQMVCCSAEQQAAEGSATLLVQELLRPFSLEDFAEKFWERMPLVIRGRCVSREDV